MPKNFDKEQPIIQIATPFLGEEEWLALKEPLSSGWLTQGPKVAKFEKEFAEKHEVKYAFAVTSCTTALHLALAALQIKLGDAVLVPSFTWVATVNAIEYCGARPIFCDSDYKTYNIDINSIRSKLKESIVAGYKPKAIIPVHLFGLCADLKEILAIAHEFDLKVIEDAACASGARYKGKYAGSMGDIGCFSFHPRKIITTGEGGMCTTNDDELAKRINCLRNHGASLPEEKRHVSNKPYIMPDFDALGYNYRMTDLQGALGSVQLHRLEGLIKERRHWALYYNENLADIEWLSVPYVPNDYQHTYQAYVCKVDEAKAGCFRNDIMEYLMRHGVNTRPGTHAVHELGYYAEKYDIKAEEFPRARDLYATTMALPLHNNMTPDDYERVVTVLKEYR